MWCSRARSLRGGHATVAPSHHHDITSLRRVQLECGPVRARIRSRVADETRTKRKRARISVPRTKRTKRVRTPSERPERKIYEYAIPLTGAPVAGTVPAVKSQDFRNTALNTISARHRLQCRLQGRRVKSLAVLPSRDRPRDPAAESRISYRPQQQDYTALSRRCSCLSQSASAVQHSARRGHARLQDDLPQLTRCSQHIPSRNTSDPVYAQQPTTKYTVSGSPHSTPCRGQKRTRVQPLRLSPLAHSMSSRTHQHQI